LAWGGRNNGPRRIVIGSVDASGLFRKYRVPYVRIPPSLALDADSVRELKALGCKRIELRAEDGKIYRIAFDKFVRRAFVQTRTASAGEQYFCLLEDFERIDTPAASWTPGSDFPIVDAMRAAAKVTPVTLSERNKPHPGNNFPVPHTEQPELFKVGE
jgi:hypothetical protein